MFDMFGDNDGNPGDDVVDEILEFKEMTDLLKGDFGAIVMDEIMQDVL